LHLICLKNKQEIFTIFMNFLDSHKISNSVDLKDFLNSFDTKGNTPIMYSVVNDNIIMIWKLVEIGVDLEIKNKKNKNLLHISIESGSNKSFLYLNKYLDLNETDDRLYTPLILAAHYNRIEMVRCLLDLLVDIEKSDIDGNTALHHSIINNNFRCVKMLLTYGACEMIKNKTG